MKQPGWFFAMALLVPPALAATWVLHSGPDVRVRRAPVTTGAIAQTLLAVGTLEPSNLADAAPPLASRGSEDSTWSGETTPEPLRMQVLADLDESDLTRLRLFEPATFTVSAYPYETFRGVFSGVRSGAHARDEGRGRTGDTSAALRLGPDDSAGYVAIVDVGNPDGRLATGMRAVISLPGDFRVSAIRIPNDALAFEPPDGAEVRAGSRPRFAAAGSGGGAGRDRQHHVWTFDGTRFTAIPVTLGLSDDSWTELVGGNLHPGDQLVVGADLAGRGRS